MDCRERGLPAIAVCNTINVVSRTTLRLILGAGTSPTSKDAWLDTIAKDQLAAGVARHPYSLYGSGGDDRGDVLPPPGAEPLQPAYALSAGCHAGCPFSWPPIGYSGCCRGIF